MDARRYTYGDGGRMRRRLGSCEDCGGHQPVRTVVFWVNGMRYRVCKDHEREYVGHGLLRFPLVTR